MDTAIQVQVTCDSRGRVRWTEELKETARRLSATGMTAAQVAAALGVREGSVAEYVRKPQVATIPADTRTAPCGCGIGRRCPDAERLWQAVRAACDGGRGGLACQAARNAYYAHVGQATTHGQ